MVSFPCFFPVFLSVCVTCIIFLYIFFLHLLPGPSEWSALIGTGMEGECMLVWFCKKKKPMWEFSHLEKCFFHAQKEAFLVEKNNCGFWKINWGGGGGNVSIVFQCSFVSEVLFMAVFVLLLWWFQLLCLKAFIYHHLCFACVCDCTCMLAVDLSLNITAMKSSGSSLPTWGNCHGDLVSTVSMK